MRKKYVAIVMACFMAMSSLTPALAVAADVEATTGEESAETSADNTNENPSDLTVTQSLVKTGYVPQSMASAPQIVGEAAIVVDMNTGYTLYEKNIQMQLYPASITKIMTATLALENLDLQDIVTFSHDAVFSIEPGSSSAYADEGEQLTVEQCLYGLMLISGNDLANGLAEKVSGNMDAFALKMTEKAKQLGCIGTQFKNAHGLHDDGHFTTAYDMAIIGINAYKNFEMFRTLCSTVKYQVPPTNVMAETRYWLNNNRMIREGTEYYYPACIGGKTGFTDQAGGTLVTFATISERPVICVVLKSTNSAGAYADSIALYDYIAQNVTAEDYAQLDSKAAEDESIQAALAAAKETTTAVAAVKQVQPVTKETKKEKGRGAAGKIIFVLVILFILAYLYVSYQRYLTRQRHLERRRKHQKMMEEETVENRRRRERQQKYRNYDFTNKR